VALRWGHGSPEAVLPHGRAAEFNQAMMELGATVCGARRARCDVCPIHACGSRGRVAPAPVRRARGAARFEDTDRYARGQVVAALAAGEGLPGLAPERLERVLGALERDGLVVRDAGGVRLP
jgi:A/G-specific adenine glycosylase